MAVRETDIGCYLSGIVYDGLDTTILMAVFMYTGCTASTKQRPRFCMYRFEQVITDRRHANASIGTDVMQR